MRERSFRLDPLLGLRTQKVDEALRELAHAAARKQERSEILVRAEKRREEHKQRTVAVEATERRALLAGSLRVADLQSAEGWNIRVAADYARLARHSEGACSAAQETTNAEEAAKALLATRRVEQLVVERQKAKWTQEARKAAELADEESSLEAWTPRAR